MQKQILTWHGPIDLRVFDAAGACSVPTDVSCIDRPVVYLWCIRISHEGEDTLAVNYVGSADDFKKRMHDHCKGFLGRKYSLFDPQDAVRGEINILYMPSYDEWNQGLEQVARQNFSLIKLFWTEVEDKSKKEIESALKIKLTRKQETRGYLNSQEQMTYRLHHDRIENRFPDGCKVRGL